MRVLFFAAAMVMSALTYATDTWVCHYNTIGNTVGLQCMNDYDMVEVPTHGYHYDNPDQEQAQELMSVLLRISLCDARTNPSCAVTVRNTPTSAYAGVDF